MTVRGRRSLAALCFAAAVAAGMSADEAHAAVTATVTAGELDVTSDDAGDPIVISCQVGNVKVNGADPSSGAETCATVTAVDVDAGGGADTVDLAGVTTALFPQITGGDTTALGGAGTDRLTGSPQADTLVGGAGADTVPAGAGDDSVAGSEGDDSLLGEAGRDTLVGGQDGDRLVGGDDDDLVDSFADVPAEGSDANDSLLGGNGNDAMNAGDGNDTLVGAAGTDTLFGEGGVDRLVESVNGNFLLTSGTQTGDPIAGIEQARLTGGTGANRIDASGFPGVTTLTGGAGNDTILGGQVSDSVVAGSGGDSIVGNLGSDTLRGDSGRDAILSRDGVRDRVLCGSDRDTLVADGVDLRSACESVDVPAPPAGPQPDRRGPRMLIGSSVTVRNGLASVRIGCPVREPAACRGTVSLTTARAVSVTRELVPPATAAQRRRARRLRLGRRSFTVAPGLVKVVRIRVPRRNLRVLLRIRRTRVRVRVRARDQANNVRTTTRTVRLRARR